MDRHIKAKKFQQTSALNLSRLETIPNEVSRRGNKTVATVASAIESKIPNKNERLIAFMSILLSTPNYDRSRKHTAAYPANTSAEAMEILPTSAYLAEQAKSLFDAHNSLAISILQEM